MPHLLVKYVWKSYSQLSKRGELRKDFQSICGLHLDIQEDVE